MHAHRLGVALIIPLGIALLLLIWLLPAALRLDKHSILLWQVLCSAIVAIGCTGIAVRSRLIELLALMVATAALIYAVLYG